MRARSILVWLPIVGLAAWGSLALARASTVADEAALAETIVMFMILVAVPLALPATARGHRTAEGAAREQRRLARLAAIGGIAATGAALPAFVTLGPTAAAWATAPWLLFCGLMALHGLSRLLTRARLRAAELAIDVALLVLPGAAVWLLVFRGEWFLGGFGGLSAVLTAAHFHAAGFGTLVMAGLLGRALAGAGWLARAHAATATALMIAFPLLAAGIGSGIRGIELAGAGLYVVALPALALLQIAAAIRLRDRPGWSRALLGLSAATLLLGATLAGVFAAQGFYGAAVPIATMLRLHGLVNAIGFVGLGLLAWRRIAPAPIGGSAGIPFSRLRAPGRVGAQFLATQAPTRAPAPGGLVDALAVFDRQGFAAADVDPAVRAFYEATGRHSLTVTPRWRTPFRLAGRLWHAFGRSIGQLALPLAGERQAMPSRIVAVGARVDGRAGVRGWVRRIAEDGPPVYVAAYATHRDPAGQVYMNIAFPLPRANLTSVLRIDHDPARPGGLSLTSCAIGQDDAGDQGVYLVTALGALRLPMNETIWVWNEAGQVRARHVLWVAGLRALELEYAIAGG